jgi:RNA 2',3'-cyclic 3'-phosphodiesterase
VSRLRTFLGIALDPDVRSNLVTLQQKLGRVAPDVKWVEEENLHLTLLFLGEVDERELMPICRAAQDAVANLPPFTLAVQGVGCFPNPRRPRTLWIGVGAGAQEATAVHDAIEQPLLALGCYRREERRYTPHITLGRVKSDRPADALALALQKHADWVAGESRVHEVAILSSQLTRNGPLYTVLGRAALAAGK